MDEVALAGLLQTTKFVQTLHSYMPKAWFEIFAFLALVISPLWAQELSFGID
jgi:hypothetical protein